MSIRPNRANLLHLVYQDGDECGIKRHVKTSERLSEITLGGLRGQCHTCERVAKRGLTADNIKIRRAIEPELLYAMMEMRGNRVSAESNTSIFRLYTKRPSDSEHGLGLRVPQ